MTLSNSRINTAFTCEYQYKLRYIDKLYPESTFSFFLAGDVVHAAIEAFYQSRISWPGLFSSDEQVTWLIQYASKKLARRVGSEAFEMIKNYGIFRDNLVSKVAKETKAANPERTKLFLEVYKPMLQDKLIALQHKITNLTPTIEFKKTLYDVWVQIQTCLNNFVSLHHLRPADRIITEFDLSPAIDVAGFEKGGRIDRIEFVGEDYFIWDYKTGTKYWNETTVSTDDQLLWYAYALSKTLGRLPSTVGILDLLHDKQTSCRVSDHAMDSFLIRLNDRLAAIKILHEKLADETLDEFDTPIERGEEYTCGSCQYALEGPYQCKFYRELGNVRSKKAA